MFEKFTKDARATVVEAQVVARDAHNDQIDGRHLLVALASRPGPAREALAAAGVDVAELLGRARNGLTAGDALDPAALAAVGIDLDEVTRRTEATFGEGALARAGRALRGRRGHIPFTPDAKKSLELALREAIRLGSREITGGHLLLGLTRADSPARRLLADGGADLDRVRHLAEGSAEAA
ncbi:Clp protease N-terminal domain-containing protein [Promicromonospora thailandica]|uniref:Clp amino terminal domain-containing protein, pathogenicity island component n=1 Tax=Promicromonospora thailandica TaxID=765201 RepID=A0A9X2JVW6_9MICO|nr:Clp protease N-terminal domain-containing protein [Promicromonospora thailandica]MCP2264917.1 Clp amino terminal domain-containing protein, pathogenicity island component [Promicromonospora thailandica]BFF18811.1 Clp protease N-terminal domain-containing protein [Promicromonospora thailandica]